MIGRATSTAQKRMGVVRRGVFIALLGLLLGTGKVDGQRGGNAAEPTVAPAETNASTTADQETTTANDATSETQSNSDAEATTTQTTSAAQNTKTTDSTSSKASPTQQSTSSADLPNLSSTSTAALPALTSSAALPTLNTGLPILTQNPANVPTYQVIIPQNVAQNPFLQTSTMPEGTVFIIVGSALAGLALMLIGWRAIYIWCLHRETSRHRKRLTKYAEMEQRPYNTGNGSSSSTTPFATGAAGTQISLDYLRPGDRTSRVSTFSSRPGTARPSTGRPGTGGRPTTGMRPASSGNPLTSSGAQFYSPSAHPGGTQAAVMGTAASRDSAYLPAGYYLRDPSNSRDSTISTSTLTPRQMYNTPNTASFLYADPSAPPIPRLSRSPTANTTSTMGGNVTARPNTAGGGSSIYSGVLPRPGSGYRESQVYASTGYGAPQPRRGPSSSHGEVYTVDRRSKPSQVLDELLGGR